MKEWTKRCTIILAVAVAFAAIDSFARPSAWTVKSLPKKTGADLTAPVSISPSTANTNADPGETSRPPAADTHDAKWFSDELNAGAVAIDARPVEKFQEGHVPGALSLPFEAFTNGKPQLIDFLPTDGTQLIIYCEGGDCDASHKVQTMLSQFGITKTTVFDGGFPAWQQAGFEVEGGQPQ